MRLHQQIVEDVSEKTFQMELAFRHLHKIGFTKAFMNRTSQIPSEPVDIIIPTSFQSVSIRYVEDDRQPWHVTWLSEGGGHIGVTRFSDFAEVIDDIESLKTAT